MVALRRARPAATIPSHDKERKRKETGQGSDKGRGGGAGVKRRKAISRGKEKSIEHEVR